MHDLDRLTIFELNHRLNLMLSLKRQILDHYSGWSRKGMPCRENYDKDPTAHRERHEERREQINHILLDAWDAIRLAGVPTTVIISGSEYDFIRRVFHITSDIAGHKRDWVIDCLDRTIVSSRARLYH